MSESDDMLDTDAIEADALNNNNPLGVAGAVFLGDINEFLRLRFGETAAANNINVEPIVISDSSTSPGVQRAQDSQIRYDDVSRRYCPNPRNPSFNLIYPDMRRIAVFADNLRDIITDLARYFAIESDLVEFNDRPGTSQQVSERGVNEYRSMQTHSAPGASTSGLRSRQRRNETYSMAPVASTSGLHSNQRRNETSSAPMFAYLSGMDTSSTSMIANTSDSHENQLQLSPDFAETGDDMPIMITVFISNAREFIQDMQYFNESLEIPIYFVRTENSETITAGIERVMYDDVLQVNVTSGFEEFSPLEGHRYLTDCGATHVIIHLDYNFLHDIGFTVTRMLKIGDKYKAIKLTYFNSPVVKWRQNYFERYSLLVLLTKIFLILNCHFTTGSSIAQMVATFSETF